MKKGQSSTAAITIIAILVVLVIGGYIWYKNSNNGSNPNNYGNNSSSTSQSGWQTYTWGALIFQYPSNWSVSAVYSSTSTDQIVELLAYANDGSATGTIDFGGLNKTCANLPKTKLVCSTFYSIPVYTTSTDGNVVGTYNQLLPSITHGNFGDDFKISAPAHIAVWEGGQTYSVDWVDASNVSTTKVTVEIFNASTSQMVFSARAADNGRFEYAVSNAKAASSTLYYVQITASGKVATTSVVWNGWSDPFYIEAAGPQASAAAPTIHITAPFPNAKITSPYTVKGTASGNWYFEASFPIQLLDGNGNVIYQTNGQAQGDWMTTAQVPFAATLTFTKPATATGTLVLMNDNPSGNPATQLQKVIPVKF